MEHLKMIWELPTVAEYQRFRGYTDWSTLDDLAVEVGLNNSLFSVKAVLDGRLVGIGRVVGDGSIYFYIQDVIIAPKHRSKGIGHTITEELMKMIREVATNDAFVGLMAADGTAPFYHKLGFHAREKAKPGMYQIIEKQTQN